MSGARAAARLLAAAPLAALPIQIAPSKPPTTTLTFAGANGAGVARFDYDGDVAVNRLPGVVKFGQTSVPINVELRNNVFVRDTSNAGFFRFLDATWSMPAFDSDYNVFQWKNRSPSDSTLALKTKGSDTSIDTWKSVKGKDAHSKWGDPLFTDPAHFDFTLLEGSPAVDAGVVLPVVWRDKLWVARPRGPSHDCGVFEK